MVRVALVTSSFLPRVGGVEEHVAHVAVELRRRGHDVVIWSVDQGDDVPTHFEGMPLRYLPCPLPSADVTGLARFVRAYPRAADAWARAVDADRPDILQIHCFGPNGVYAAHWARRRRVPFVYSNHGETFMDADNVFARSWLLRSSLSRALSRAAAVTSCSRFAADDLDRFGSPESLVRVVPNGVDMAETVGALPDRLRNQSYILGLGRLVRVKGFDVLIEAYAHLASAGTTAGSVLVIAGDGPEASNLRRHAEHLGVADRVHFLGSLSRPTVGAVMRSARALVVPSQVEAFGITILEGWRAGIPVVATDRGGPSEFIADGVNGILVDPFASSDIAAALRRLLSSAAVANDIGAAGHSAVAKFSWEAVVDTYENLFAGAVRLASVGS